MRLGLGAVPATLEDVVGEIGDRLDVYQPRLREGTPGIDLTLTVVAGDLWLAVLLAMAAVTDVGYAVMRLEAWSINPNTEQPARR